MQACDLLLERLQAETAAVSHQRRRTSVGAGATTLTVLVGTAHHTKGHHSRGLGVCVKEMLVAHGFRYSEPVWGQLSVFL
jgi:hypothetical protein